MLQHVNQVKIVLQLYYRQSSNIIYFNWTLYLFPVWLFIQFFIVTPTNTIILH